MNFKGFHKYVPIKIGNENPYWFQEVEILMFWHKNWEPKYLSNVLYVSELNVNYFHKDNHLIKDVNYFQTVIYVISVEMGMWLQCEYGRDNCFILVAMAVKKIIIYHKSE